MHGVWSPLDRHIDYLKPKRPKCTDASHDAVSFAREKLGFEPDEKQAQILLQRPRRLALCCSRQWGKSTVSAIAALYQARTFPGSQILVVGPSERQSAELVLKVKSFATKLGLKVRGDAVNRVACVFPNGSRVVAVPSCEEKIRGFSAVSLMLIDEAARVSDELYRAVRPMLATTNGSLWLLSTPYGKRGFFYNAWVSSVEGWMKVSAPATECSRISAEFLAGEREALGEAMFRQEYLCEFVQSSDAMFNEDDVRASVRSDVPPLAV